MTPAQERVGVRIRDLRKHFPLPHGFLATLFSRRGGPTLRAVDGVDLAIAPGEIVGVAGESGSGKTTLGMTIVRLYEPTEGAIWFGEQDISHLQGEALKAFRREAQIVFQDPYGSLDPRLNIFDTVAESLRIHGVRNRGELTDRVSLSLQRVRLDPSRDFVRRFPHELSGGQRQRVAIARAIVLEPRFLVADEPVSMLDVSVRAGIIEILNGLSDSMGLTMLYISHDLSTIRYICHRTAVMYLGRIVEIGSTEDVIQDPQHPYTQALVAAVPVADPLFRRSRVELTGGIPSPIDAPQGCAFRERCPSAMRHCGAAEPMLRPVRNGRAVACFLYE